VAGNAALTRLDAMVVFVCSCLLIVAGSEHSGFLECTVITYHSRPVECWPACYGSMVLSRYDRIYASQCCGFPCTRVADNTGDRPRFHLGRLMMVFTIAIALTQPSSWVRVGRCCRRDRDVDVLLVYAHLDGSGARFYL